MRRFHLSIVLSILTCTFMVGCSGFMPKREVIGNDFLSNNPDFKVNIPPDFKYLGKTKFQGQQIAVSGGVELDDFYEIYVFVKPNGHKIDKAIMIEFHKISTSFISDFYRNIKAIEKGVHKIDDRYFQYYTAVYYPSSDNNTIRFIMDKGYVLHCGLIHCDGRLMGGSGKNQIVGIYYYESLEDSGFACKNWDKGLTDGHHWYLDKYKERQKNAFSLYIEGGSPHEPDSVTSSKSIRDKGSDDEQETKKFQSETQIGAGSH